MGAWRTQLSPLLYWEPSAVGTWTWGDGHPGACRPGCEPALPGTGPFLSLGQGGLTPPAAEKQLFGSQRHKCPHVPLSSLHSLGTSQPFGAGGSGGRRAQTWAAPALRSPLSPHSWAPRYCIPAPHTWFLGAALGWSHLPPAQRADLGGDTTAATINHSLTLLQRLQELLQNGNSSDTVLRVRTAAAEEAKVFHTHQLLLSLQSEVFESLLRNQSVITLHEPPETAALFEKFIR